ncbi:MAG TPA: beta-ketoacyl synthase chain length factor [Saprospiraceae bacterium]|mgnify:FL=1|nr:beta-ketoacyl synthase chain length factor [Saprospiraceae bacterium]
MSVYVHTAHVIAPHRLTMKGASSGLAEPDYSRHIDIRQMRRMSKLIKMGVYSSMSTIEGYTGELDGIIVATGLGCISDTYTFMKNMIDRAESMLAPTAFIQSTHNTLAGTLGILLANHSYNITWSQRYLSLHFALQDAMLQLDTTDHRQILLTAADEVTDEVRNIIDQMECLPEGIDWSEGAVSFLISNQRRSDRDWKLIRQELIPNHFVADTIGPDWSDVFNCNNFLKLESLSPEHDLTMDIGHYFLTDAIGLGHLLSYPDVEKRDRFISLGGDEEHTSLLEFQRV